MLRMPLAALVVALTVLVAPSPPADGAATDCSNLEIMAHRGYHEGSVDENSLTAFDDAAARGYAIETDARADADGQIWLFHDRDVHRATGATGYIDQMSTPQAASLRYLKAGSALARIQDAITVWQAHPDATIYLEPKVVEVIPQLVSKLRDAGLLPRVYFTADVPWIERNYPGVQTAPKFSGTVPDPTTLKSQGADAALFDQSALSPAQVDAYHAAGLRVQQAETSDPAEWRAAIDKGFDAILTDAPDELRAFCPVHALPPSISSFSPTQGPAGTRVLVEGANFIGATAVAFGSVAARSFTVLSDHELAVTVPGGVDPSATITVTTPEGSAESSDLFTLTPGSAPVIESLTPASGVAGSTVVISGSDLGDATDVLFGDTSATSYTVDSPTQITAVVPPTAPATGYLQVASPEGTAQSDSSFVIPPTVQALSPGTGSPGTAVLVTGANLGPVNGVTVGSVPAAFVVGSPTQLTVTIPDNALASAYIVVTTDGGTASSPTPFKMPPRIDSLTPGSAPTGSVITIAGGNFIGITKVKFGGIAAASYSVNSPTQITVTVPAAAPASALVSLVNAGGTAKTAVPFKVVPVIQSFSPTTGPSGTHVVITGSGFTGATKVKFGTLSAASFSVGAPGQITAVAPKGAPANSRITVTTPGGSAVSTQTFGYRALGTASAADPRSR